LVPAEAERRDLEIINSLADEQASLSIFIFFGHQICFGKNGTLKWPWHALLLWV